MTHLFILLATGLIFLALGYFIGVRKKVNLIHSYHYTKVKAEDIDDYASKMGEGVSLMGSGMIASGVIDQMLGDYGWTALILFLGIGFIIIIRAQYKYNGGIF